MGRKGNPWGFIQDLVLTLRPKQWIKNSILFAPLLFSQNFFQKDLFFRSLEAFVLFCLLTGSVYTLNDLRDLKEDRRHPLKKNRPLASGRIPPLAAWVTAALLLSGSLVGGWRLSRPFFGILVAYGLLQVLYNLALKHQVILDIFAIAAGFVLRVVAGGATVG